MACKWTRTAQIIAVMLLMIPHCINLAAEGTTSEEANTYYVKKTTNRQALTRRMALVGHNCMVSRLTDGVEVGTGSANLQALCNEDLTDHYTIPSTASVTLVAGSPIVGVRDMKHYFDKSTKAGFKISGESSVLKLSVLKTNYMIRFYRDGKILKTSPIEEEGYTVLDLNVGNINMGSDAVDIVASEQPDEDYDEIALVGGAGIDVSVVKGLEIYYAFVGDGEYTLTNTNIAKYNTHITLTGKSSDFAREKHLTDDDLTNDVTIAAVVELIGSGYATVQASNDTLKAGEEVFPTGTEAGYVISTGGLLNVGVTPTIILLDKDGNKIYEKAVSSTILGLDLSAGQKKFSIKAPCAFSGVKFIMPGVSVATATVAKYAFIVPQPTTAGHQCEMSPASSLELCCCDSRYQLRWDQQNYPNAAWNMVSSTDDQVSFDATNNTLDFSKTEAYKQETDQQEKVSVVMRLTNTDGCYQDITINYGGTDDQQASTKKDEAILANPSEGAALYELGDGTTYGVNILSIIKNSANIISSKLNSFATYFGGVSIGDSYLCSIHKKEGVISDGSSPLQAGFVVTAKGSALSADVLKLMNVRIYKDGTEVGGGIATSAISAKLIGAEDTHKLRYSINVPSGVSFDEIRLYSTGLLGANLNVMNIYYAYTADQDAVLDSPTEGATIVSFDNTNASIDAERTQSINVVSAGNSISGITNSIDGNLETAALFPIGVNVASGSTLAVKLGVTASRNKQLVIVVNKEAAGLGLELANAMVIKTYKTGEKDPIETYDDWSVLGANVITLGDKGYVFLTPQKDYDEVTITEGKGASALNSLGVYGILLRNDKDGDGTPDADEPSDDCKQDIVFQETVDPSEKESKSYKGNLSMYFQRTFVPNQWNSVILPVNLTKEQFVNAFGNDAKLAEAKRLYQKQSTDGSTEMRIVGFETTKVDANNHYLKANIPYIIWISDSSVKAHKTQVPYYTWDAGAIDGEIYVVDKDLKAGGVTFTTEQGVSEGGEYDFDDPIMGDWELSDLQFIGSYDPHQELKADSYIFNNGKMFHLSQSHWMKGFRCWLEPTRTGNATQAKMVGFGFDHEGTTDIKGITDNNAHQPTIIYNLNGQKVDSKTGVQPGIFIVGGKKVVIR